MSHWHLCYPCKNISFSQEEEEEKMQMLNSVFSLCRQIKLRGFTLGRCYVFLSGIELIR